MTRDVTAVKIVTDSPFSPAIRRGPVGRQARVLTLLSLCAGDVRADSASATIDWLCAQSPATISTRRAAESMVAGITEEGSRVDEIIGRYAAALPVRLLAVVDRNILRVAIYELFNRNHIPRNVVINEAVELASMFGSESSARFVNGVLGSVAHDLQTPVDSAVN